MSQGKVSLQFPIEFAGESFTKDSLSTHLADLKTKHELDKNYIENIEGIEKWLNGQSEGAKISFAMPGVGEAPFPIIVEGKKQGVEF